MRKLTIIALLLTAPIFAQIPAPQIALTGNIGCQGFPCLNNGTIIMATDADHAMTARETSAFYIKVVSSVPLTATRNLIAPIGNFPFTIENATTGGQAIQIIGPSGTGVTIANSSAVSVWNDGTNYVQSSGLPLTGGNITGNLNVTSTFAATTGIFSTGPWVDVHAFGAICDGAHPTQDTAAFQAAFASLGTGGGTVTFWNTPGSACNITGTIDMMGVANASIGQGKLRSLIGWGKGSQITCNPSTALTACIKDDTSHGTLKDFTILANSNVTYPIEITLAPGTLSNEVTDVSNVFVSANGSAYGVGIGPDTGGDVSHVSMHSVVVTGAATAGIVVGNGTQANVLDNACFGCTVDTSAIGVWQKGGGFSWYSGGMDENTIDFKQTVPSSQPFSIDGIRSEGSNQFWLAYGPDTVAIGGVQISNVLWTAPITGTGTFTAVQHQAASPITITNSLFGSNAGTVTMVFSGNTVPSKGAVTMSNVGVTNHNWGQVLAVLANNKYITLSSSNDFYWDSSTNAEFPGSGTTYLPSINAEGSANIGKDLVVNGNFASALGGFGPYANYALHSLFDNGLTGWPYDSTQIPTVTLNQGVDVFGNTTAMQITAPIFTGGQTRNYQITGLTMVPGNTYQFSVYLQGLVGGEVVSTGLFRSDLACEPNGGTFPPSWTLTTTRTLYVGTCTPTSSELATPFIIISTSSSVTSTVYASQAQVCQVGVNCGPQVITKTAALIGSGAVTNGSIVPPTLVSSLTATSPLVSSASSGDVGLSCPTCSTISESHYNITSTDLTHTGDTTETTVASFAIPTTLSNNSLIQAQAIGTTPAGSTGTCTVIIRYSTTNSGTIGSISTTEATPASNSQIVNQFLKYRNSTTAGIYYGNTSKGAAIGTNQISTTSYSHTSPTYLIFNLQNSNSADTCQLNSADVWIWNQ